MNEVVLQPTDDAASHAADLGKLYSDNKLPSFPFKDQWKPVSGIKDSNVIAKNVSQGK